MKGRTLPLSLDPARRHDPAHRREIRENIEVAKEALTRVAVLGRLKNIEKVIEGVRAHPLDPRQRDLEEIASACAVVKRGVAKRDWIAVTATMQRIDELCRKSNDRILRPLVKVGSDVKAGAAAGGKARGAMWVKRNREIAAAYDRLTKDRPSTTVDVRLKIIGNQFGLKRSATRAAIKKGRSS